jgi:CRISPR-associated endonuclease/helicase Cas3
MISDFNAWFQHLTNVAIPHPWQSELATDTTCRNRLIRIPTGFGKTAGTVLPWLWHRIKQSDPQWPARLVFCLPMRVLVEQTEANIRGWLETAGLLWDGHGDHAGKVGVHVLMGGSDAGDWHLHPEHPAILIGTQDMLLSRALNRGYAAPRARWPMEFGLLNQDSLWVVDEVQLMDVGLATSAQMQAFRFEDEQAGKSLRPSRTWWMSATLQPRWLESVDTKPLLATLPPVLDIPADQRNGILWEVRKPRELVSAADNTAIAELAAKAHQPGTLTLVVVNRVDDATEVFNKLAALEKQGIERRLVHSRFRPWERKLWREDFLNRNAPMPAAGRIIVATQVVEAGVDLSAATLITALAPWPSLVQRFGRCARYGGTGKVFIADAGLTIDDDKRAAPYAPAELVAAREAMAQIEEVSPAGLEDFEATLSPEQRAKLYPYAPKHLLLRRELDELFDTTPDLTGADLDISRYLRSGDERDCQVWWLAVAEGAAPDSSQAPIRDALCAVPFYKVQKWLFADKKPKGRAWTLDYLDGRWRPLRLDDCRPGQVIAVDETVGGYDPAKGWTGEPRTAKSPIIPVIATATLSRDDQADQAQNREDLSTPQEGGWQTIATHGGCVGEYAIAIAHALHLPPPFDQFLGLAGRLHDWGKVHPAFRACIRTSHPRHDLAKAPQGSWVSPREMYNLGPQGDAKRGGFRHELASTLALFELLAQRDLQHPALLGDCAELIAAGVIVPVTMTTQATGPLPDELAALTAPAIDLVAYLVCSHHGKIRVSWHATPDDQQFALADKKGMPLRGICEDDELPALPLLNAKGEASLVPAVTLHLDSAALGLSGRYGRSWRERTAGLQHQHGPFALALLEACLRAADIRASRFVTTDPLLDLP